MAFKVGAIYGEARLDTKKWSSGLKKLRKTAGIAALAIGAAFVVGMTKAIKAADEFQKSFSNVTTLIDTSVISTQKLARQLLFLDPALGKTTELTNGLYQAFSAGAKTAKEAMQVITDSAMFAKAAITDTNTAVTILSGAINAYGRETYTTTQVADIFFQTIKKGVVTGEQLAGSIGTSIPLYSSVGIKLEELAAGMAAMTKMNVNANIATTQLNAIVSAFLKPSETMIKALEDIGYESGSAFLKAEGLAGALKLIEENTKGDAAEMAVLLPNIRALRGAMALTGVGGKTFTETLKEMENAAGTTKEAFKKQEKTFDTLRSALGKVQIVVGNVGKHFVDKIAAGATQAAQSVLSLIMSSEGMNFVAQVAGYAAGGFELIKGIVEPLFETIKESLTIVWGALTENLKKITGEASNGAVAMKILSVVINSAIASVHVLTLGFKNNIDYIANMIIAIKASAKALGAIFNFIDTLGRETTWQEVVEKTKTAGKAIADVAKDHIGGIGALFRKYRDEVKSFSGETEDLIVELIGKFSIGYEQASSYIKMNWAEMTTGQQNFAANILEQIRLMTEGLKSITDKGNEELDETTEEKTKDLIVTWEDYYSAVLSGATHFYSSLFSIVSQYHTNAQAELDLEYQADLAALDLKLQNELITEEQYQEAKDELDKEALDKKNELAKKIFKAEKINKIAGVWIDAASAIQGWWSAATRLGPIFGPIFGGIMTAATTALAGVQTALIKKQKFVPAMEKGGTVRVNEKGGEIINLPDNTLVIPNDISRQIAKAGGSSSPIINISFAGAHISDEMDLDRVTNQVIRKLGKEMRLAV